MSQEELARLYSAYSSGIYGFAYAILRNKAQAEDVLQATFTKAITHLDTCRHEKAVKTWLYITAKHLCIDSMRRETLTLAVEDFFELPAQSEDRDEIIALNTALNALEEEEKQILILHVVGGLKYKEIGEILSIPAGTVGWKYSQTRKKLRAILS